ncbi:MAG: hypothetical protein ACQERX_05995 [Bacillota bacterium]
MNETDKLKYKVCKLDVRDVANDMKCNARVLLEELERDNPDMELIENKLQKINNAAISINGLVNYDENEEYNVDLIDFYQELAEEMGIKIQWGDND